MNRCTVFLVASLSVFAALGDVTLWPDAGAEVKAQPSSTLTMLPDGSAAVRTGTGYEWPGLRVDFKGGDRDLSKYGRMTLVLSNTTANAVRVMLSVKSRALQGRSPGGSVVLKPFAEGRMIVSLDAEPWALDAPLKLEGMNGFPRPAGGDASAIFDIRKTVSLHVFRGGMPQEAGYALKSVTVQEKAPAAREKNIFPAATFLPFVDVYGQFKHDEWPGKIHSAADLEKTRVDEAAWLEANGAGTIADTGRYGGWLKGPKLKATGFFRTEKVDGKWWLVDPEGHLFFSHGVDCVNHGEGWTGVGHREGYFENLPAKDDPTFGCFWGTARWKAAHGFYADTNRLPYATYNLGAANMVRKYGKDWQAIAADMAHRRIRAWGLNTIANWSQRDIYGMDRTPYTATFSTRGRTIEGSEGWWGKFRDPFSPEFEKNIRADAEAEAKRSGNDPWCIGWFVDNELSWGSDDRAHGRWILRSPASQPAKAAARDYLVLRYGTVQSLNAAWGTSYADWNAFMASTKLPDEKKAGSDLEALHRLSVGKYFRTVAEAIRRVAPNRLYLGSRIAWGAASIYREAARYCDVVSVNIYSRTPDRDLPADCDDKPMINGEFHFGALDRGMFHTGLVATADQNERAACYRDYVNACLDHPRFVGTHWFQWKDQPLTGRSDGENYQIGFLTITDTPYPEIVEAAREVGSKMYERRFGSAR